MEGVGWISWIIIGLIAGWIAEKVTSRDHGLLTNLVVGLIGGVIGGWLSTKLGLQVAPGFWGSLLVATAGAIILLFIVGIFRRR
ncbi:putative membrane protein YeaQ/YmgE (transglycosylase-associated protein family) [Rhodoligotrophos appendicifer]|uniref:GlsB/YeaQ/YmgE family stress response membrane protein n=1 Tax=Rhodoligotrophos appendicifer TaxID=987056 RepID=UPI001186CE58|nr:GlsB/YeaQ/YmgE family stress response membrane protein [Rhodoligotrophos appendicifer]